MTPVLHSNAPDNPVVATSSEAMSYRAKFDDLIASTRTHHKVLTDRTFGSDKLLGITRMGGAQKCARIPGDEHPSRENYGPFRRRSLPNNRHLSLPE